MIERAVVLARGPLITVEDLPSLRRDRVSDDSYLTELMELPLEQAVASLERRIVLRALERSAGNKAEAARLLGINRQQLYAKLKTGHRVNPATLYAERLNPIKVPDHAKQSLWFYGLATTATAPGFPRS